MDSKLTLTLTEDQRMMRELARDFAANEILPLARDIDSQANVPDELVQKISAQGFMGVNVPTQYGGAGMDSVSLAIAIEEIARACASTAVIVAVNNGLVCGPLLRHGTEEQKKKYLPDLASGKRIGCYSLTEAAAGSDVAAMKTTALKKSSEYILNGAKLFVSNGRRASLAIVFAVTDATLGHKGISAFIVEKDTPGFTIGKTEEKLGIKGSETVEFIFDDCAVPADNLLGQEGEGFKIALTTLNSGRIGIAAQSLGIAQACLDASISYSKERVQFKKPIAKHQAVAFMIADMAMEIEAARLLVLRAASMKDAGKNFIKEASMAKLYASEAANRTAYAAIQVHGGYGFTKDFSVERHYRDARITTLYEGTSEMQRMTIAKELLK